MYLRHGINLQKKKKKKKASIIFDVDQEGEIT